MHKTVVQYYMSAGKYKRWMLEKEKESNWSF